MVGIMAHEQHSGCNIKILAKILYSTLCMPLYYYIYYPSLLLMYNCAYLCVSFALAIMNHTLCTTT